MRLGDPKRETAPAWDRGGDRTGSGAASLDNQYKIAGHCSTRENNDGWLDGLFVCDGQALVGRVIDGGGLWHAFTGGRVIGEFPTRRAAVAAVLQANSRPAA